MCLFQSTKIARIFACLAAILVALAALTWSSSARAYVWMLRHDGAYVGCAMCHADPSGGALLTQYGRNLGEQKLRTYFGKHGEDEEVGSAGSFLFGAFPVPDPLLLGGDVRRLYLHTIPSRAPATDRYILMQADLQAQVSIDWLRANVSAGYVSEGALGAALTVGAKDRLVSRTQWVGAVFGDNDRFLVRAGRFNIPFGLRVTEHTLWARTVTRTDTNASQQHGVALAFNVPKWRAEVMGIAGNFQVSPDAYRERGYSAFVEHEFADRWTLGASSLLAHSERDISSGKPTWRHAHGLFSRYSPSKILVLLLEADGLLSSTQTKKDYGLTGMLQADVEPSQGLHFLATAELLDRRLGTDGVSYGLWGSAAWFFAPHADARVDLVWRSEAVTQTRASATALLAQMHFYF